MSNMENTDNRLNYDLRNFGKAMKDFAIAKLIWTTFLIIIVVVLQSPIEDLASLTEEEMMNSAGSIMLLSLFVIFGFIVGGIYKIGRYFIYVTKLNKASSTSISAALRTNFYIEIIVLITYVIMAFFSIPLKIIIDLVSISLIFVYAIYLGNWVKSLSNHAIDENKINRMFSSIRIMKIGLFVKACEILRFFTPASLDYAGMIAVFIGDIILAVGMLKTGNELFNTFSGSGSHPQHSTENSIDMRNRGPVQRPPVQQPQNENVQYPMYSNSSTPETSESKDICPYCGSPKLDPNTIFCSVCGKKFE